MSLKLFGFVLCLLLFLSRNVGADEATEPPLPQAMGAINDYAAVLGKESRQQLQSWIDELKTKAKISVFLLITLLDPYSDPPTFTDKLWKSWQLEAEGTIFLLLAREADQWVFYWRSSPDVASRLASPRGNEDYGPSIQKLLGERRVGTAAMRAVEHLREKLIPSEPQPKPEQESPTSPSSSRTASSAIVGSRVFWYVFGGIAGAGLTGGMLWLAFVWLCPSCGGRLSRRSAQPIRSFYARGVRKRAGERVYYCHRCGYRRVRRRER